MKTGLKIIFLGLILILIIAFVVYKIPYHPKEKEQSNKSSATEEEKLLERLTLDQKIGQLFIIGFEGKVLSLEIESLIKEFHPGGILLLERNIENEKQLKELIDSLQKIALEDTGLPLFIAVDQEGGLISRIDWIEKTPQSEIDNQEEAYQIGKERGDKIKELGINLNLAPLLDITEPGDFIHERTFHKNATIIKELSEGLIQGQKDSNILTAIKHFPGYGKISFNPEEKLAVLEEISEKFQFQGLDSEMIMTSNVIYDDLDPELPFTFSEKGIQFLKDRVKGDYLIISDDLAQNSLLNEFSLKEIVSLPIKAGVDILIFSGWRVPAAEGVSALRQAVQNNEISEQRINQSVLKIIKLKQNEIQF